MDLQISIGMRTDRRLTAGMGGPSRPTPYFCELVSSCVPSPPPGRRAPSKSGVGAGSWSRVPAHRPRPPPPPPLGAPPQTSSEKNPKAMPFRRDRPPAHFPRHSPSIRRDFSPTKAPLSDNARKSKGGPSLWLEVLRLNKAHVACQDPKLRRGQSRSRLDHRPGLLPCEKSPHLRVCGAKNLEGQAAGNKVS